MLTFQHEYVVPVIVLVFLCCFFRSSCALLAQVLEDVETRCSKSCALVCCGCQEHALYSILRYGLILFLFSQPVVLLGIHTIRYVTHKDGLFLWFWDLADLGTPAANASWALERWSNESTTEQMRPHVVVFFAVDYMFLALPYAFSVMGGSLIWVYLGKRDVMVADSPWDESLSQDVFPYELMYYVECVLSHLLFVSCIGSEMPWQYLFICATLIGVLQCMFVMMARWETQGIEDQGLVMLLLLALFLIMTQFYLTVSLATLHSKQSMPLLLAVVHIGATAAVVMVHVLASGKFSTASILLCRLACTATCCLAQNAFLLLAR